MKLSTGIRRPSLQIIFCAVLASCAFATVQAADKPLSSADVRWLDRVTYGVDSATITQYRALGRKNFLEAQLAPANEQLPPAAQRAIDVMVVTSQRAAQLLLAADLEGKRINALVDTPGNDDKAKARQAQQEFQERLAFEAAKRHLLRAVYSPAQLKEQMTWFWMNHFSVFRYKGNLRWSVADYEERAIRPNALGNFRDLLAATLKHPAMLVYLDNAQSAVGKINENYARELLELHTMGVGGDQSPYTQQDVQELARILTGVGVNVSGTPAKVRAELQSQVVNVGAFEFNPARHDYGDKVFMGHTITGKGLAEVDEALDVILQHPATAHYRARKLAVAFVADEPPSALVDSMASIFARSKGDIASTLRVMFNSKEFNDSLGSKFKDPMHYVVSALRLAYDAPTVAGKTFVNLKPANNMLGSLGEGLYGRLTPDGYGLREIDWASSGQMSKRFEIAKWIGSSNAGLFDPDDGTPAQVTGFPQLSNRLFFENIEPTLSPGTRDALGKAAAQWEWNAYLLSSPEFMMH
jgi:uncharacterized protein (DUF1800 family)